VLTFNETVYEIGSDPFDPYWGANIGGYMDSDSTTPAVVINITNMTGLPWTSYLIEMPGGIVGVGLIVDGSAESIEFPQVTYGLPYNGIEFSGPELLADGESLTIGFDVWTQSYKPEINVFRFNLKQNAIPEPTTISLLAVGVLTLLRKRRSWKRGPQFKKTGTTELGQAGSYQ